MISSTGCSLSMRTGQCSSTIQRWRITLGPSALQHNPMATEHSSYGSREQYRQQLSSRQPLMLTSLQGPGNSSRIQRHRLVLSQSSSQLIRDSHWSREPSSVVRFSSLSSLSERSTLSKHLVPRFVTFGLLRTGRYSSSSASASLFYGSSR